MNKYEQVDIDLLRGLGGRWVSARFEIAPSVIPPKRAELVDRVTTAFVENGWEDKPYRERRDGDTRYVLSEMWETGENDLFFSIPPQPGSERRVSYECVVYIADDAGVVCIYTTIGW